MGPISLDGREPLVLQLRTRAQLVCFARWFDVVQQFLDSAAPTADLAPLNQRMGKLMMGYSGRLQLVE